MERIRSWIFLNSLFRLIHRRDDGACCYERAIREEQLRVDGSEITRRAHDDPVCRKREECPRALGLIRNDHRQSAAASMCLSCESNGRLAVSTRCTQEDVKILARVHVEQNPFERCDAMREERVTDYDETALVLSLVPCDERLTFVARCVLRLEERTAIRRHAVLGSQSGPNDDPTSKRALLPRLQRVPAHFLRECDPLSPVGIRKRSRLPNDFAEEIARGLGLQRAHLLPFRFHRTSSFGAAAWTSTGERASTRPPQA